MTAPMLSIVIPSYNGCHLLEPCLASIRRYRPREIPIEVIVVDDASTDETQEWLERSYPEVGIVRRNRNGGFVLAANDGIRASRGRFVQLLNNDAEVTEGWAEAGLDPFRDSEVGSVAPLVLWRSDPSRVDSAGDRYSLFGWPSKRGHGEPVGHWLARPVGPVFGASGSSAFYRRSALDRAGLFDPSFGSYYEDVDLAFRLRWAGFTCVFTPECRILHDVSASYDHASPSLQRRMARNAEILFWSNLPTAALCAAVIPHFLFLGCQAGLRLARGTHRAFVQGKRDAWVLLKKDLGKRRRDRRELAGMAFSPPRFPLQVVSLADVRNHLNRPFRQGAIRPR